MWASVSCLLHWSLHLCQRSETQTMSTNTVIRPGLSCLAFPPSECKLQRAAFIGQKASLPCFNCRLALLYSQHWRLQKAQALLIIYTNQQSSHLTWQAILVIVVGAIFSTGWQVLAVHCIFMHGRCSDVLPHRFKLQARYEKCIGPLKTQVNALIRIEKSYLYTLNMAPINKEPRTHLTLSSWAAALREAWWDLRSGDDLGRGGGGEEEGSSSSTSSSTTIHTRLARSDRIGNKHSHTHQHQHNHSHALFLTLAHINTQCSLLHTSAIQEHKGQQ